MEWTKSEQSLKLNEAYDSYKRLQKMCDIASFTKKNLLMWELGNVSFENL